MPRRRCAWCGRDLPVQDGDEDEPDGTSHGICRECLEIAERVLRDEEDT